MPAPNDLRGFSDRFSAPLENRLVARGSPDDQERFRLPPLV
jgi:hypothetical protein